MSSEHIPSRHPRPHGERAFILLALVPAISILIALAGQNVSAERSRSEDEYHNDPMTYLVFSFVMTYATMAILLALFTLKYGQKRARFIAAPMLLSGLVIWGIWFFFNLVQNAEFPHDTIFGVIHWVAAPLLKPFLAMVGAVLGGGVALFIFLTVIVRS